jgi:hypothetical protein
MNRSITYSRIHPTDSDLSHQFSLFLVGALSISVLTLSNSRAQHSLSILLKAKAEANKVKVKPNHGCQGHHGYQKKQGPSKGTYTKQPTLRWHAENMIVFSVVLLIALLPLLQTPSAGFGQNGDGMDQLIMRMIQCNSKDTTVMLLPMQTFLAKHSFVRRSSEFTGWAHPSNTLAGSFAMPHCNGAGMIHLIGRARCTISTNAECQHGGSLFFCEPTVQLFFLDS